MDFYDGLPGVAFFLGYLAAVDPAGGQADLAAAALTTVLRSAEDTGRLLPIRLAPSPAGAASSTR